MTDSLGSILGKRDFSEPPEIQTIKSFVKNHVGGTPKVKVSDDSFIIIVPSSAMAGALRTHLTQLKKELNTKKRIVLRIGS